MQFLSSMEQSADIYVAILTPARSYWNTYPATIRSSLRSLSELRVSPNSSAYARGGPKILSARSRKGV